MKESRTGSAYTLAVALFAAMGTFLFGFDTGIVTTTIAHKSWVNYMGKPSTGVVGAVVSAYVGGEALGAVFTTFMGDKLGRVRFMQLLCIIVTIGVILQTAAVNIGMFIAGRTVARITVGITGVNVIQYYQTTLYRSLGMTGQTVLALAAAWGTCGFLSNVVSLRYLSENFGRRTLLMTGLGLVVVIDTYSAIMQRQFQHTDNKVGKGFAILGIYLFVVGYYATINSTTPLYGAEVLPMAIRSRVVGLASATKFCINAGLTQTGPSAFANIGENYYYVFVGFSLIWLIGVYLFFPETKGKTLEEIASAFGDKVVDIDQQDIQSEDLGKPAVSRVSHYESEKAV